MKTFSVDGFESKVKDFSNYSFEHENFDFIGDDKTDSEKGTKLELESLQNEPMKRLVKEVEGIVGDTKSEFCIRFKNNDLITQKYSQDNKHPKGGIEKITINDKEIDSQEFQNYLANYGSFLRGLLHFYIDHKLK